MPIKDIKTFIRTMRMLVNERPDAQGWIVGPEDEDPSYVNECKELVDKPGLEGSCQIPGLPERAGNSAPTGPDGVDLDQRGAAAGGAGGFRQRRSLPGHGRGFLPGAHRRNGEEDRALGAAGSVVYIADPEGSGKSSAGTAQQRRRSWHAAQQAGLARVKRYYDDKLMFSSYRILSEALVDTPGGSRASIPRLPPAVAATDVSYMAGIGFEIRKILERDSYWSVLRAYGYAGLVSGGPWVLSILSIMMIGVLAVMLGVEQREVNAFQICVTYMMAGSLIWTGGMQLMFTRFVSRPDICRDKAEVLPNLFGVLIVDHGGRLRVGSALHFLVFHGTVYPAAVAADAILSF